MPNDEQNASVERNLRLECLRRAALPCLDRAPKAAGKAHNSRSVIDSDLGLTLAAFANEELLSRSHLHKHGSERPKTWLCTAR